MPNTNMSQQALMWLKANSEDIVTRFVRQASLTDPAHYRWMSAAQRRVGPDMVMVHVIERMEGKPFPMDDARMHYVERLQKGAQLTDLSARADMLHTIIRARAESDLRESALAKFVVNRTAYAISLLKTAMIDALVTYQTVAW